MSTLAATLIAALAALLAAPAQAHPGLASHQATYRLSLGKADAASGVIGVKGRLEVDFQSSCDGATTRHRLGFRVLNEGDEEYEHLARYSSFETADGRVMWFSADTYENRELVESVAGEARRDPDTGRAEVRFSRPETSVDRLPDDTLFPVEHIAALIESARTGVRQVRRLVFDGSSAEGLFEISASIGSRIADDDLHEGMARIAAWPMRLAYFPPGGVRPDPEFQMDAALYENGVAGDMGYDYGDFTVAVALETLEVDGLPACD